MTPEQEQAYATEMGNAVRKLMITIANSTKGGDVNLRKCQILANTLFVNAFLVAKIANATDESVKRTLEYAEALAALQLQDLISAGILKLGDYRH